MRALTVWQPYATMIALGWKPIENRGWLPRLEMGERFAIHAAARPMNEETWEAALCTAFEAGYELNAEQEEAFMQRCCRDSGRVLATVEYRGALDGERGTAAAFVQDLLPWWNRSAKGWILSNPQQVQPVAVRGKQGLWTLPDDVVLEPVVGSPA